MCSSPLPWRDLRYALWLPFYLLLFLLLERLPGQSYFSTQLPPDGLIPFCPWFPLLAGVGVWLWLRHPAAFRRYMSFLAATFLLSELIWCLFPSVQELRPSLPNPGNPLTAVIAGLYRIDTPTNVFPSVHVVGAVGAALLCRRCAGGAHLPLHGVHQAARPGRCGRRADPLSAGGYPCLPPQPCSPPLSQTGDIGGKKPKKPLSWRQKEI